MKPRPLDLSGPESRCAGAEGVAVRESRPGTMSRPLVGQAAMRLSLLDQLGDDLSDVELLSFALQHAVADMRGLGAMAHRCG